MRYAHSPMVGNARICREECILITFVRCLVLQPTSFAHKPLYASIFKSRMAKANNVLVDQHDTAIHWLIIDNVTVRRPKVLQINSSLLRYKRTVAPRKQSVINYYVIFWRAPQL
jgi:hypothetical protein